MNIDGVLCVSLHFIIIMLYASPLSHPLNLAEMIVTIKRMTTVLSMELPITEEYIQV